MILSSCNFDNSINNFKGGELLNNELISQIKEEILSDEQDTSMSESEEKHESTTVEHNEQTQDISVPDEEDTDEQAEASSNSENQTELTGDTDNNLETDCVYWLEKGSVWHLYKDCRYIKNSKKEIMSGSIEDAKKSGAENVCKTCDKKSTTK